MSAPAAGSGTGPPGVGAATRRRIEWQRDRYPHPRSAILPSLWAVQEEFGYLHPEGLAAVAEILGLAPSEVQAVSTFYSMYFQRPGGRHHVLVCVNVACALRGSEDVCAHLERRFGVPSGGTTEDGEWTWESTIECLGACGYAPMMQIDHHFHEHLTSPERIDEALARAGSGEPVLAEGPVADAAAEPQTRIAPLGRASEVVAPRPQPAAHGVEPPPAEGRGGTTDPAPPPAEGEAPYSTPAVAGPSMTFTEQVNPGAPRAPGAGPAEPSAKSAPPGPPDPAPSRPRRRRRRGSG